MKDSFEIKTRKSFNSNSDSVMRLFRDETVFKLTGADEIQVDFKTPVFFILSLITEVQYTDTL